MPLVWRLTSPAFARKLDGEGNRRHGARWNSPGRGVVYASVNLSLGVLETLVHLPPELRTVLPPMSAVGINLPDQPMEIVAREEMDSHANDLSRWCRARGDAWLIGRRTLMLSAPSIIVPQEQNIMLNPIHPDMALVSFVSVEGFKFDERLIRKLL
jgi:RES domain-containing protein